MYVSLRGYKPHDNQWARNNFASNKLSLYEIRNGSAGGTGKNQYSVLEPNNSDEATPQQQLAKMCGMSVDTLNNYKKLTEMIPELEDLVDTGVTTPTTAQVSVDFVQ